MPPSPMPLYCVVWNRIPKGPHMKRLLGCLLVVGVGFESGDLLEANLELTGKRSYGKKP